MKEWITKVNDKMTYYTNFRKLSYYYYMAICVILFGITMFLLSAFLYTYCTIDCVRFLYNVLFSLIPITIGELVLLVSSVTFLTAIERTKKETIMGTIGAVLWFFIIVLIVFAILNNFYLTLL